MPVYAEERQEEKDCVWNMHQYSKQNECCLFFLAIQGILVVKSHNVHYLTFGIWHSHCRINVFLNLWGNFRCPPTSTPSLFDWSSPMIYYSIASPWHYFCAFSPLVKPWRDELIFSLVYMSSIIAQLILLPFSLSPFSSPPPTFVPMQGWMAEALHRNCSHRCISFQTFPWSVCSWEN